MCEISPPNNDNQSDWVVVNLRMNNIRGLTQFQKVIQGVRIAPHLF